MKKELKISRIFKLKEQTNSLSFDQIFDEPGLYVADGFEKGHAFEISKDRSLYSVQYQNQSDILPTREVQLVYRELFGKRYRKIFTRQSLFK